MNIDLNELDFSNAGNWPLPVKLIAILAVCGAVGFAGYWFDTKEQLSVLDKAKAEEETLKTEFKTKQAVAANLAAYKQQMKDMEKTFGALLLQLPSKTEVAELLVDVSREGLKAGLEFELFKPKALRTSTLSTLLTYALWVAITSLEILPAASRLYHALLRSTT